MSRRRSLRLNANSKGECLVKCLRLIKFCPLQWICLWVVSEGGVAAEETWGTGSGEAVEGIGGTRSGEAAEDFNEIRGLLPERLFATDRFPCERVNTYSAVDHLLAVRNTLKGTPEIETLLGSCFGSLFKLPVRRVLSGKAVHGMLTRQVVTKKKYELWPVFGVNPFRVIGLTHELLQRRKTTIIGRGLLEVSGKRQ